MRFPEDTFSVPLLRNVLLQAELSVTPTFTVPPFTLNTPVVALLVIPVVAAPVTFVVPPDALKVPVFNNVFVIASVFPETVSVPPLFTVTPRAADAAAFTVTVVALAIIAASVAEGTNGFLFQVVPSSQLPFATDTKGTSAAAKPI